MSTVHHQFVSDMAKCIDSLTPEQRVEFMRNLEGKDIQQTEEKKEIHESGIKNLDELEDDQIIEIDSFEDLPADMDELHVANADGTVVWTVKGKKDIAEFLEHHKSNQKKVPSERLKKRLGWLKDQRKSLS
jgi:hypothetical protein